MVRRNLLAIAITLITGHLASAQTFDIEVAMEAPMPNTLQWDDVWNVTIDNNFPGFSGMPTTVNLIVQIETSEVIYEASTKKFMIPKGVTTLNAAIANTLSTTILAENDVFKSFFRRYNEMPDGTYQLCVSLNLFDETDAIIYTANNCIIHEVSHPGIIILNTPMNGDTVESELLQFNWTHATERVLELDPFYVLDLVPIINDQAPEIAIAVNPKRLSIDQLDEPYMDFPQIGRALDTGQAYAWRVIAYTQIQSTSRDQSGKKIFNVNGGMVQEIARSEVGFFVCGTPKSKKDDVRSPTINYYIDLNHETANQTYFFDHSLPLSLANPYGRRILKIKFFNAVRDPIELTNPPIYLDPGVNKITIDLSSELIKPDQYYFAELRLSEEEVFLLKLYKKTQN